MSAVDKYGVRAELPRSPVCREVELLGEWARGNLSREYDLWAWCLKSVWGYSDHRIAKAQGTTRRTVRKRLDRVSEILAKL